MMREGAQAPSFVFDSNLLCGFAREHWTDPEVSVPTPALGRMAAARKRRHEARLELIANNLRLQTLTSLPVDRSKDEWAWDERDHIERRNAELRQVIDQTYQDTAMEGHLQ